MRKGIYLMVIIVVMAACQQSETLSEFTGNEITYALQQGSDFPVGGSVTIKELKDGTAEIEVALTGTEGSLSLPVHLHLGDISVPDAEIAALLNPVDTSTGKSKTHLTQLADESAISYKQITAIEASIKVHLADDGPERDIILAGGNIGALSGKGFSGGRIGIGVCKSE